MKHLKIWETFNDKEEDNLEFINTDFNEFYSLVTRLINKYNIRWVNGKDLDNDNHMSMPKYFSDRRGEVKFDDNKFYYYLPLFSDTFREVGDNNFKKYNMYIEDGVITMGFQINRGPVYLKKPSKIYNKRTRKEVNKYLSDNNYEFTSMGKSAFVSKVKNSKEILSKLKEFIRSLEYVEFNYDNADIRNLK